MQQPTYGEPSSEEQKDQERQGHLQSPQEEAYFDHRDVLNDEENRKTGEYQTED